LEIDANINSEGIGIEGIGIEVTQNNLDTNINANFQHQLEVAEKPKYPNESHEQNHENIGNNHHLQAQLEINQSNQI